MFITFEGLDFSGKSTQAKLLKDYLESKKIKCLLLREPGGPKISEKIRETLLDKSNAEMTPLTEFLLFSASRSQLVNEVIKPNLKKKIVVICDRYYDSSSAYQGYGGKLDLKTINKINDFATGGLKPDLTFFFDISPKLAFERSKSRAGTMDRMENKKLSFYENVYKGFKALAKLNRKRVVTIDGIKDIEKIHEQIVKIVNRKLKIK